MARDLFVPALECSCSVVVTRNRTRDQWRLVLTTPASLWTEVVTVDNATGMLLKQAGPGYPSELAALTSLYELGFEAEHRGDVLLGYAATACVAGVLLATKTREKGVLPGGHAVMVVTDSTWLLLPLSPAGAGPQEVASAAEQEFWRLVQQVTLDNAHFYCWTADLSRPFPSPHPPSSPAREFVWNSWLAGPLEAAGLAGRCPILFQGAVEISCHEAGPGSQPPFAVALVSRRSRRHPGTRYLARGLNNRAGPGNEIECELVVWTLPEAGAPAPELRWARSLWRRGTVPIWWGVELASLQKGLAAEVYIRAATPYLGSVSYFRGVQRALARYAAGNGDVGAPGQGPFAGDQEEGLDIPVTCVNLLHCNPAKASELMLSSHFQESMRHVRRQLPAGAPIRAVNFDWHGNMGRLGEEAGVEGFWSFIEPFIRETGLSYGTLCDAGAMSPSPTPPGGEHTPTATHTAWPGGWAVQWEARQRGVLRYNCADSLDRTNAATCFATLPVLQEALRTLGVDLASPAAGPVERAARLRALPRSAPGSFVADGPVSPEPDEGGAGDAANLPPGWEVRWHAGRPLFIDHVNRRTQWKAPAWPEDGRRPGGSSPPPPGATSPGSAAPCTDGAELGLGALALRDPGAGDDGGHMWPHRAASPAPAAPPGLAAPWAFFSLRGMAAVRSALRRGVVADYVEAFRVHGDINSFLYTGSPAMHSHVLGLVLQASAAAPVANTNRMYSAASSVGKLQNLRVAVQRRWNNTVSDGTRQLALELFLGLKLAKVCPGLRMAYGCERGEEEEGEESQVLDAAEAGKEAQGAGEGPPAPAASRAGREAAVAASRSAPVSRVPSRSVTPAPPPAMDPGAGALDPGARPAAAPAPPSPAVGDMATLVSPESNAQSPLGHLLVPDLGDPLGALPVTAGGRETLRSFPLSTSAMAQQTAAELDLLL